MTVALQQLSSSPSSPSLIIEPRFDGWETAKVFAGAVEKAKSGNIPSPLQ